MKRRDLLTATCIGVVGPISGCLEGATRAEGSRDDQTTGEGDQEDRGGDDRTDPGPEPESREIPLTEYDMQTEEPVTEFEPGVLKDEVSIGDRVGPNGPYQPHTVRILNSAGSVELYFTVVESFTGNTVHKGRFELSDEEEVRFSIAPPSEYLMTIESDDFEQKLSVPCVLFDCNDSETRVLVEPDRILATVSMTLQTCSSYCEELDDVEKDAYL